MEECFKQLKFRNYSATAYMQERHMTTTILAKCPLDVDVVCFSLPNL